MATIKVRPIARKNPVTKETAWYVKEVQYSRIKREDIIEAAQRNSSVPRAYIEMTFDAMVTEIKNYVMNGHSITLNRLGTINAFLRGNGNADPGLLSAKDIRRVRFSFRASAELRKKSKGVYFLYDGNIS